ncbi:MAG: DJ-1/PfpI family protein, partial [Oligoflexales bacterium]|nr:DJ-1/PfpI family protein [Oligoflexales bacterium]
IENIDVSMVKCLLVPGGDPHEKIKDQTHQPLMKQLLQSANSRGVLIGAICAGPAILGKYEILKGKKFTHGYGDSHKDYLASLWQGATFTDRLLEVDGTIVTAKPSGHIDFGLEVAALAGAINPEQRKSLICFYKGV